MATTSKVSEANPTEQGLKPFEQAANKQFYSGVSEANPTEQGLKHDLFALFTDQSERLRGESNRTRIETEVNTRILISWPRSQRRIQQNKD